MERLARQGLHNHCRCHPPHATPLFRSRVSQLLAFAAAAAAAAAQTVLSSFTLTLPLKCPLCLVPFIAYLHLFHTYPLTFPRAHALNPMSCFAGPCFPGQMLSFTRLVSKHADSSDRASRKLRMIFRGTRGLQDGHLDIFC